MKFAAKQDIIECIEASFPKHNWVCFEAIYHLPSWKVMDTTHVGVCYEIIF